MSHVCTITTGSRLHFGPLSWKPSYGRFFGGWGIMIETPATTLKVGQFSPASVDPQLALSQTRAKGLLERLSKEEPQLVPEKTSVQVLAAPPSHCGLGSGTQLSLAMVRALGRLSGLPDVTGAELARLAGRGERSAIGLYGFDLGGLIVDAGKAPGDSVGQLAARCAVPDDWRFVLLQPPGACGLMGAAEVQAFSQLPPFSEALTDRLSRIVLTELLPAVHGNDPRAFAAALDEYGDRVGGAFAGAQGGVVHQASQPVWSALRNSGVQGIAQTSWGPTLAVVCANETAAAEVQERVRQLDPAMKQQVVRAMNQPACITLE